MPFSDENTICPESTIESANRRNFIKKAAAVTAAAGIGSTLLAKSVFPESSASSATTFCCIVVHGSIKVNSYVCGSYNNGKSLYPGLVFGSTCLAASGEGIASNRSVGLDQYGLDFYTACTKRMSIRNDGVVVIDPVGQNKGSINCCAGCCPANCRGAGGPGIVFGALCSTSGIASNRCSGKTNLNGLDFYTCREKRLSITGNGSVIVHCRIGVGNCTPNSPLCVFGVTCATTISAANTCHGTAILGCSAKGIGIKGVSRATCSSNGIGVKGVAEGCTGKTFGVFGTTCSPCGTAVYACGSDGTGIVGVSSSASGVAIKALAGNKATIAFVARAASGQTAPLQEWQNSAGTPLSAITASGAIGIGTTSTTAKLSFGEYIGDSIFLYDGSAGKWGFAIRTNELRMFHGAGNSASHTSFGSYNGTTFTELMRLTSQGELGIGTETPATNLAVNGSIAAKIRSGSGSITMNAQDFAILASGSSTTVTLPPADTQAGMIVFVKNVNTTNVAVTVEAASKDNIDGNPSFSLADAHQGATFVSDGIHGWYVLANTTS